MKYPFVSCICNTNNRVLLLRRSISCFMAQTYPNKELLIACLDSDNQTYDFVSSLDDKRVRVLRIPAKLGLSLGELRNLAIEKSVGEFFCIWDDDDWYHCKRLEIQVSNLQTSHKQACILSYILIYNVQENKAFLGHMRMWEGSLLCEKEVLNNEIRYGDLPRGEDSFLVNKLISKNMVYPLAMPQLYVYVFHTKNTSRKANFDYLCRLGQELSFETSILLKEVLNNKLDIVEGSNILSSPEVISNFQYIYWQS